MTRFTLTPHAIDRYRERVRPGLSDREAECELGGRIAVAPEPVLGPEARARGHSVDLGDGVSVIVNRRRQRWLVVTCINHGASGLAMHDALARAGLAA